MKVEPMTQEIQDPDAVVIKINAALKKLYAQAIGQLDETDSAGAEAWHRRYEVIRTIIEHSPPLYLAGGFATAGDFFTGKIKETRQTVYRGIRVAKLATAHEVATFTAARLSFAIAYVEARDKKPLKNRGDVDFSALQIHFKRDGKSYSKSLNDIAYADHAYAVGQATGHHSMPTKQTPVAKAVTAAVKASGVKDVKATVSKKTLTLRIPLAGISAVGRQLAGFKLPEE